MVINRYMAALLQIAITVVGGYSLIGDNGQPSAYWGLAALGLQGIVTYLAPLTHGAWRASLKTGASAAIAALTIIVPLIDTGMLSPTQIGIAVLAALNVIAAELGVAMREDNKKLALAAQSPEGVYNVSHYGEDEQNGV